MSYSTNHAAVSASHQTPGQAGFPRLPGLSRPGLLGRGGLRRRAGFQAACGSAGEKLYCPPAQQHPRHHQRARRGSPALRSRTGNSGTVVGLVSLGGAQRADQTFPDQQSRSQGSSSCLAHGPRKICWRSGALIIPTWTLPSPPAARGSPVFSRPRPMPMSLNTICSPLKSASPTCPMFLG